MNLRNLFGGQPEPQTPAYYEIALNAISSGVMVADKDRNIIYANPAVYNLLKKYEADIRTVLPHFSADNLVGQNIDQFHKDPGHQRRILARSFPLCTDPPTTLNMTGEGVLSVRAIADRIGAAVGREPVFVGHEADTALLGDTTALVERLGSPETPMDDVIDWMARWVTIGGTSHGKPTKYESRTGDF